MIPRDFTGPPSWQGAGSGEYDDDFEDGFSPISWERDPYPLMEALPVDAPPRAPSRPSRPPWPDESWPPRSPRRRRLPAGQPWLLPAALIAVIVASAGTAMLLIGPSGSPSAAPAGGQATGTRPASPPATRVPASRQPLTLARARSVLASYTSANNAANANGSDTLLGAIETGSSYAIDAGIYRVQQAEKAAPYPAFGPRRAVFYIPGEPTAEYPHWFAVQVANAELASPGKVTGTEYLVFTQAAPGAPWLNAVEPYVLTGAAIPRVALDADGLAITVGPHTSSLAVAPARIGALTATALDGGQAGAQGGVSALGTASPGNLADRLDLGFWKQRLPTATVTDRHAPTAEAVFGLRTTDGGALLFYTDTAELTLVPPAGETLHLTIPGFYSPGQSLAAARIGYLEQFATYVPPPGGSGLRIVADYSGITAKN